MNNFSSKYHELFTWYNGDLDDVIFWERSNLFAEIAADFQTLTRDLEYDFFAPLEARGFLLAGLLAGPTGKPILPIRKYKPFFDRCPGVKADFVNWKGEPETLFVFRRELFLGKKALILDDVIETGNSLSAALQCLSQVGCTTVGAFYLYDALQEARRKDFAIPIRALLQAR